MNGILERFNSLLEPVQTQEDRHEAIYQAAEREVAQASKPSERLAAMKVAVIALSSLRAYLELRGRLTGELLTGGAEGSERSLKVISVPELEAQAERLTGGPECEYASN
jgi:hypothetical protein